MVSSIQWRIKLGTLLDGLRSKFFSDENSVHVAGQQGTMINVGQYNEQHQRQDVRIDLADKLQKALSLEKKGYAVGSVESTVLDNLKKGLPILRNTGEMISMIIRLAKDAGLNEDFLIKIFQHIK